MNNIFVQFAAFENEILAIQARKEQIVMETDDDARDKDVPAEKDRIGLTEVRNDFLSRFHRPDLPSKML